MRSFIFLVLTIFLLSGTLSYAAEAEKATGTAPAASLPVKIGVVDMQIVATESEPAKAARDDMEKKYGKEKADLEKRGEALKKQAESLKKQADSLKKNPKASEQKKVDFIKDKQKLDQTKQKLDQDTHTFLRKVEQDEIKIRQDMVTLVFNATYEVARAQGYTFVVDVNAGGVLYAEKSMDLTSVVLEEVNKLYQQNKDKKPAPAQKDNAAKPAAK